MMKFLASGPLQTVFGEWEHRLYWLGEKQAIAMVYGEVQGREAILCRVHSSCITSHVFMSTECDCREQLAISMGAMQDAGSGVVIWLDQEGRGHGMYAHISSQALKRQGLSQSEAYTHLGYKADARDYSVAPEILADLGVISARLMTNNPDKVQALIDAGVPAVAGQEQVYIDIADNDLLRDQYIGKIADGHDIDLPDGKE